MDFLPAAFAAMASYHQFIVYTIVPSKNRPGKFDKLPVDHKSAHDSNNWMTADVAILEAKRRGNNHGVGFVFTREDPFFFLDIDNCYDTAWSTTATQLLNRFPGAAVEVSSSGRGLHIIGSGKCPPHGCTNRGLGLEFYTSGRFVALTGTHASGDSARDFTPTLETFISEYFPTTSETGTGDLWERWEALLKRGAHPDFTSSINDEEIIVRACKSVSGSNVFTNKSTFKDLWENNISVLQETYNSNTNAMDAGLAQHLAFWTGGDGERIKRLMLLSALYRDKWDRRDYLPRTILKACERQTNYLMEKQPQSTPPIPESQGNKPALGVLSIPEQTEMFKDCVYILDEHAALIPGGYILNSDRFNVAYGGYVMPLGVANAKVTSKAWEAFTQSTARRPRIAHSSCFRPTEKPGALVDVNGESYANIYYPVETKRIAGDVTPFLNHVKKVYPDPQDQLILIAYMAAIVQFKGIKFQWAPLLQGTQGNGKTFFSQCVGFAIGNRYTHYPEAKKIAEKFNDWLYAKIFISVEDIFISESRKDIIEVLKPRITGSRYEIEPKGGAKITRDICANFILNSNHKEGLRKTKDDRRFCPLYCAQQSYEDIKRDKMDGEYFPNLYKWAHSGGFAIINNFLNEYQIPKELGLDCLLLRAPLTSSTEQAITHGLGKIEQEILECVESYEPGFRGGWISTTALDSALSGVRMGWISHNKRSEILLSLGYIKHPGLTDGRATRAVLPDMNKPRLYVKKDHDSISLKGSEVLSAYEEAQKPIVG